MKNFHRAIFVLLFILVAGCSQGQAAVQPTQLLTSVPLVEVSETVTLTPTVVAATPTPGRKVTRMPVTARPTDMPTLTATITPTFDFTKVHTYTPMPAAVCPQFPAGTAPTPEFIKSFPGVSPYEFKNYINSYGWNALFETFGRPNVGSWKGKIQAYQDLTNDGVPEMVFGSAYFFIVGCEGGKYKTLLQLEPDGYGYSAQIVQIADANRNGVPELSLRTSFMSQGGSFYIVIEWDGKQFQSMLEPFGNYDTSVTTPEIFLDANGSFGLEDVDHDGVVEYAANMGIPVWDNYTYDMGIPWREETQYYKWNGVHFVFYERTFSAPEYRFQALQDGDRAMMKGAYDTALDFYQQAIFSDKLEWWSPERKDNVREIFTIKMRATPTPTLPAPDPLEYDHLAAYSRYKIVVLHAARGWQSDAQVVYDTLQRKYPDGKTGHIYVQLAEVFWEEYLASQDAGAGCQAALDFAKQHEDEVIDYLHSNTGDTSIGYYREPQYLCPVQ